MAKDIGSRPRERTMTAARWAGLSYLFLIATGVFGIAYAPGQYIVDGDAAATFEKLAGNTLMFKSAIVAELACYASFVLLATLLHRALRDSSETLALLMVGFVLVSVPLGFIAVSEKLNMLPLLAQGIGQAEAIDAHFHRYSALINLAEIFWGLWLLPYGLLVLKSRAIPWFFGVALILGCFSYVAGVIVPLFWEGYVGGPMAKFADIVGAIGEIGGALWLTIFGARALNKH